MTEHTVTHPLDKQISEIENLLERLSILSREERIVSLTNDKQVQETLSSFPKLKAFFAKAEENEQYSISSILALGLCQNVFFGLDTLDDYKQHLQDLVSHLVEINDFYDGIGGLIGYQLHALKLIEAVEVPHTNEKRIYRYSHPPGLDLKSNTLELRTIIRLGIQRMGIFAEIYPVGGAGDRLNLHDPATGEHLPVAHLQFSGRTLLEGLIRELQGREYLHYKFFGRQVFTPIVMMTSREKNNHQRIVTQCRDARWFGRDPQNFKIIMQLLVPMVAVDGTWVMNGPLNPMLKPGGHGVLWKESQDQRVFEWLRGKKRSKALIRQINNPIGGTDFGLVALEGLVTLPGKTFGFASCDRRIGAPEGMVVLREKEGEYCITNIEYTDFKKCGIEDAPENSGSAFSRFPSNTNILAVDIDAVENALKKCPIPGMLINIKHVVPCHGDGNVFEKRAGRIESTMQNIADSLVDAVEDPNRLQTFLTYNERRKTISVAKQALQQGKEFSGTPESAYYDLQENYRDLLGNHCRMTLPEACEEKEYLADGPPFVVDFHPALGGLWSIVSQKIQGGCLGYKSEWIMEIGEAFIENIDLEGSLVVEADYPFGLKDPYGVIHYDDGHCGKCVLRNVKVRNAGAVLDNPTECYQRTYQREEALHIVIHGNGEFVAENVTFTGPVYFEVQDNHRLVVYEQGGELVWHNEKIPHATWTWNYSFDEQEQIVLFREEHHT